MDPARPPLCDTLSCCCLPSAQKLPCLPLPICPSGRCKPANINKVSAIWVTDLLLELPLAWDLLCPASPVLAWPGQDWPLAWTCVETSCTVVTGYVAQCRSRVCTLCCFAPQRDWSGHASFQQVCLGAQGSSVLCTPVHTHSPLSLLQPLLTLHCLQPHNLVLAGSEGEKTLQRSTGLCSSLSWGDWAEKHSVTQLGSARSTPNLPQNAWYLSMSCPSAEAHGLHFWFGSSCEEAECWSSFFEGVLCYFWQESISNLKDSWVCQGT